MTKITIEGHVPSDPRQRILAIEAAVQAICQSAGQDPADAVAVLLTAAAHLTAKHSDLSPAELGPILANALGAAMVAADDFFTLRAVS